MRSAAALGYWPACIAVWIFGALYLAAMLVAPSEGLQVTGMLGLGRGTEISIFYGWLYTASLLATALSALATGRWPSFCNPTILFAGVSLGLTILPVCFSVTHDFKPAFFEGYVGEMLTVLSLILLAIGVTLATNKSRPEQSSIPALQKKEPTRQQ